MHALLVVLIVGASSEPTVPAEGEAEGDIFGILEDERLLVETVTSATLTKTTASQAPSLIVVLDQSDLKRYHMRTLAEALEYVAGVDVISDGDNFDVGVRGIFGDMNANGSFLKVIVDGIDTVYRTTGHNSFGFDQIPIDAIERIEIIRGPVSVVYGANAFLGVVSVQTKANTTPQAGGWARVQSGAARPEGNIGAYGEWKTDRYFFGASVSAHGEDKAGLVLPSTSLIANQPRFPDVASRTTRNDVGWRLAANVHGGATFGSFELRVDSFLSFLDASAQFQPDSVLIPSNRISTLRNASAVTVKYKRDWFTLELRGELNVGATMPDARIDRGVGDTYFRDVGYTAGVARARAFFAPVKWYQGWLGAELDIDSERMNQVSALPRGATTATATVLQPGAAIPLLWNIGVSTHHTLTPWKPLGFTLGGRWDRHVIYGDNFSYRAGAVLERPDIGYAKLLAGRSFKAPTPQQLFWQPIGIADYQGNERLAAQTANTFELVLGTRALPNLLLQGTASYNIVDNRVVYIQRSGRFQANAIASSGVFALELEAQLSRLSLLNDKLRLHAAVTFGWQTVTTVLDDSLRSLLTEANVLFPAWKLTGLASLDVRPIYVGIMLRTHLAADRLPSQTNIQIAGGVAQPIAGTRTLDVGLHSVLDDVPIKALRALSVSATIRNVFDSRAPYPGFNGFDVPRPPRTFELQIGYRY